MATDRDNRRPPCLEKDDNDDDDESGGFVKRMHDLIDRLLDEFGRVVDDRVIEAGRKVLLRQLHLRLDRGSGRERVRSRPLEYDERGGGVAVEIGVDRIVERAELDSRDIVHADVAVGVGPDDDLAELRGVAETPQRLHRQLERARRARGRLIDGARRHLEIGRPQRGDDLAGGEAARGDLRRIEPNPHRIIPGAKNIDIADAVDACQRVLDDKASRSLKYIAGRATRLATSDERPS